MDAHAKAISPPLEQLRERYLNNLEALYARFPVLAAQIDSVPFAACPELHPTRDGNYTCKRPADDGPEVFLHSRYEPITEARRQLDALPAPDNPTFVLHGIGLGYLAAELEARHDRPLVMVAEDDLPLIKAALAVTNLSAQIRAGRLLLLTRAEKTAMHELLQTCNADLMLGVQFVAHTYTKRSHTEFFSRFSAELAEFVTFARMHMFTLLKTARTTARNVALNLPHYLRGDDIASLAGAARGYPAILIAAGPSAAAHVHKLAPLHDRAVLIAVQTVFKLLRSLNVSPHFVTALDFHEVSADFFRGVEDAGDCELIAEPKVAWQVPDAYPGRVRVLQHRLHSALLGDAAPHRATLPPGATVAHLSFYLAQHLGCDPIIFLGQDLGFADGLYYMPGGAIEQTWAPELNRFSTIAMKQWERIARNRTMLRRGRDWRGREIYTDEQLTTYAQQFERDFRNAPQRVIQTAESSLRVPGMVLEEFDSCVAQYCGRTLPPNWRNPPRETSAVRGSIASESGPAAPAALQRLNADIERAATVAGEMITLLETLETLLNTPAEFNRRVARVDALREEMRRLDHVYRLVIDVSAQAELRRHQADRRIGEVERETPETARRRLRRDREFVAEFREGCAFLNELVPEALQRLTATERNR